MSTLKALRCADCKRALIKPALTIGVHHYGPVCAKRYYVRADRVWPPNPTPVRRPVPPVEVDPWQMALQLEVA